ncbi:nuclear factor of activated T-cells, cytoplasmic 1 [Indicator indicator]|uniref:nuclear factor of activated T-cells, cytoplasmic 1 n=1 Tax=Indicator indicator TaxID=1002788 RepID=UPI0023DEB643|nr:nuclear factor of activated T-cells, cytoplasmic 1 [Indicator indicator]
MTGVEAEQEFDFDFLFEFKHSDEGGAAAARKHYGYSPANVGPGLPLTVSHPSLPAPCHGLQTPNPLISVVPSSATHASGYGGHLEGGGGGASDYYLPPPPAARPNGGPPALESPRIEITSYLGLHHGGGSHFFQEEVAEEALPGAKRSPSTATLHLPNMEAYRDPSCLSPASSLSSRSCNSEASSYESNYSYPYASPQTSPWQSPCVSPKTTEAEVEGYPRGMAACGLLGSPRHSPSASPRPSVTEESWLGARGSSRPPSPCNKRKLGLNGRQASFSPHRSPTPSPQGSPRVSVTDDTWLGVGGGSHYASSAIVAAINALTTDSTLDMGDGIPLKARRTGLEHGPGLEHSPGLEHGPGLALKAEPAAEEQQVAAAASASPAADLSPEDFSGFQHIRKGNFCEQYLAVPQHPYQWAKPKALSPASYVSPSLPALDWQLPSHSGPYELRIEVQPKSHHRAHYETEGSRGAVKASAGGHPIVQLQGYVGSEPLTLQLFIGTADDRLLRPHAFYQVHRITGKTVATSSHEALLCNTKVLEIPLLPENNMRAIIDCAGILKLRNSDIELRKGETDIGRKNTRVRLVFRVHIPQPHGRTLSLQVASNPIECSQRSAQELPLVEKQSTDSFPVTGGKRMVLTGHNFLQDSKVIFVEKAPDGHHVWEMEAKTDKELCKPNSLVVEVPPFRNQRISSPVQVNFYVCNGKRKRSQYQLFTYLPATVPIIKTEPTDDYEPAQPCGPMPQGLSPLSKPYYSQGLLLPPEPPPGPCLVPVFASCQQRSSLLPPAPSASPKLHDLSSSSSSSSSSPYGHLGLQHPAGGVATIQEVPRPLVVQPSPPEPQPCSPAHCSSITAPLQQLLPKAPRREAPPGQALALPEGHEGSKHSLAPIPVTIKREPEELDQMYLDDVNEIIRNDLSSTNAHS